MRHTLLIDVEGAIRPQKASFRSFALSSQVRYYHVVLKEPLSPAHAKQLIRAILNEGVYIFSKHAADEMAKDELESADCLNVLRAGVCALGGFEAGTWRYRVQTNHITVVIAFRSAEEFVVVTAWRIKPRR